MNITRVNGVSQIYAVCFKRLGRFDIRNIKTCFRLLWTRWVPGVAIENWQNGDWYVPQELAYNGNHCPVWPWSVSDVTMASYVSTNDDVLMYKSSWRLIIITMWAIVFYFKVKAASAVYLHKGQFPLSRFCHRTIVMETSMIVSRKMNSSTQCELHDGCHRNCGSPQRKSWPCMLISAKSKICCHLYFIYDRP